MNQIMTGQLIMKKRRERNLIQEQLARKLNLSNKTTSKWETGKSMPDYGVIESLCEELEITVAELMDGEMNEKNRIRIGEEQKMLEMLKRIQNLEQQRSIILGIMLICTGITFFLISRQFGGTTIRDLISGILLGLSVAESLTGVYIIARSSGN